MTLEIFLEKLNKINIDIKYTKIFFEKFLDKKRFNKNINANVTNKWIANL